MTKGPNPTINPRSLPFRDQGTGYDTNDQATANRKISKIGINTDGV